MRKTSALTVCLMLGGVAAGSAQQTATPGATWTSQTPAQAGLDPAKLDAVQAYLGGRGFVSRYGYQVYSWGNYTARGDVASAAKPWYSHFLFKAVEEGRLANVDIKADTMEPRLDSLNVGLGNKDRNITFRHFANQTSCYGVRENPGAAYDYNDWQMALFWDTLFQKVYGATYSNVDSNVLHPKLTTPLQCEDTPTFMAFGTGDRPGRVGVSPRDFARFGLLYLRKGNWNGAQLLSQANATTAVTSPLSNSIPRTAGQAAEMISGQRSIGSTTVPDNQTDHKGSYSWLWWTNGVDRSGARLWPDAPLDVYACLGHANGKRGMAVMPTQQIVLSWNDTTLDQRPSSPHPLNEVFKLLVQAAGAAPPPPPPPPSGAQAVTSLTLINADTNGDIGPLTNGATLNLAALPTRNLNVRANTSPATVGSVRFALDGNSNYRTESGAPYALAGDSPAGDYLPWTPAVGSHTLTGTPYTESGATGTAGTALTVAFSVTDGGGGGGGPLAGQIIVDPTTPRWLKINGGGSFFMCGPGDPEGFLYRGTRNADGTRSGDQSTLINKVKGTGANCIYLQAVRSHGGDGGPAENPFVNSDPAQGLDADILNQWETWFTEMDSNGIAIFLFFYDDSARIWTGDAVGPAERAFLQGIVNRFEHHKNLIWCVAEEYAEMYTPTRVKNIAAEIRDADDHDHVIAVHKNVGTSFSEFADDPNIDQFAIQLADGATAAQIHADVVQAWNGASGRYNLNMAESVNFGSGATARRKMWAAALGGAYVMLYGMDIASTATADLQDCGRLVSFMKSTNFNQMAPHDELRFGATEHVLAVPGDSYIAYASALSGDLGLRSMAAGTYSFKWFDCATGASVNQTGVSVTAGDRTWTRPSGIGNELALYVKKTGGSSGGFNVHVDFVSTGRPYSTATARVGALPYLDRSYTIGSLSAAVNNGVLIRTANDDKFVTAAGHLKFTVSADATVYVAYDRRAITVPTWLQSGWTLGSDAVSTSDNGASPLRIYRKSVSAGQVSLGGNHQGGNTGAGSNYFVIVHPAVSAAASFAASLPEDVWEHPGDADGDGLYDTFEAAHFTDPNLADTDADGEPDESELDGVGRTFWEVQEAAGAPAPGGDSGDSGGGCGATGLEVVALVVLPRLRRRLSA